MNHDSCNCVFNQSSEVFAFFSPLSMSLCVYVQDVNLPYCVCVCVCLCTRTCMWMWDMCMHIVGLWCIQNTCRISLEGRVNTLALLVVLPGLKECMSHWGRAEAPLCLKKRMQQSRDLQRYLLYSNYTMRAEHRPECIFEGFARNGWYNVT